MDVLCFEVAGCGGTGLRLLKKMSIPALLLLSLNGVAQTTDSLAIDVVCNPAPGKPTLLMIVNGEAVPNLTVAAIAPKIIGSVDVSKKDTLVGGNTYTGIVRLTMKDGYTPSFIPITELIRKHTSLEAGPTVYLIDDKVVGTLGGKHVVDEKYILKIQVNRVSQLEEGSYINVVNLLTKSEANIKKSKEVWIRGGTNEPAANYFDNLHSIDRQMERASNK